jgi:cyclic-di-GMP phosphodiesterase TipF (flagellum assembly factor)
MMRLGAAFIAICMVLIAGSLGAALYLSAGLSVMEALVLALSLLVTLIVYNTAATRGHDRDVVSQQIADLSRGTADLARQVGEIGRRMETAEATAQAAAERARSATAPLSAEIETLGSLVKELAESVAAHEAALAGTAISNLLATQPPAAPAAPAAAAESAGPEYAAPVDHGAPGQPEPAPEPSASGRFGGVDRAQVSALISAAIEDNRIDLYLQPIVSLPQRKVRFYEAMARLRTEEGEVLSPGDFLPFAEAGGLMPRIDNVILFRCVQVVRRLTTKNRDIGVFCDVSGWSLSDPEFFPQLSEFMQANRALAPTLVLEFAQSTLRAMGPLENEGLASLAELGFRFSLDRLTDLKITPRDLAERGFRFVKAPAALLLNRAATQATDIDPADFSDLLGRFGIDLIADKIDSEGTVVDLLDYDVRFGQGLLFSPPRPVRTDVIAGAERSEAPRRETTIAAAPARPAKAQARDNAPPDHPSEAPARPSDPASGERPDRRAGMLAQLARGVVRRA